jgi:hypothetical protein
MVHHAGIGKRLYYYVTEPRRTTRTNVLECPRMKPF